MKDLKRTLRKDITKRICETFAFLLFEKWWAEEEVKYKSKVRKKLRHCVKAIGL